jgi:hypothetical protein
VIIESMCEGAAHRFCPFLLAAKGGGLPPHCNLHPLDHLGAASVQSHLLALEERLPVLVKLQLDDLDVGGLDGDGNLG